MNDRIDIAQLKDLANLNMTRVMQACGIRETPNRAGYISMCNPKRNDRSPSLTIWTKGGVLAFKDHADDEVKGDIFLFVAWANDWLHLPKRGFAESCRFLEDVLGLKTRSPDQVRRDASRAQKRRENHQLEAEKDLREKQGDAFAMWMRAEAEVIGTPVDFYLQSRGIELSALPLGPRGGERIPHLLRYLPDHPHVAEDRTRSTWPCMIAGCIEPLTGKILAVHRTWLARDFSGKAPVKPARKVWPGFAGLCIPIWRGGEGWSVKEQDAAGVLQTLVLCEGVEDGLTAALANPEHRVWAMISLGNMGNIARVLPACCDSVIVHRQNDWDKLQAVDMFERGKQAIEATGRLVAEVLAFGGKDINDTLRGEL